MAATSWGLSWGPAFGIWGYSWGGAPASTVDTQPEYRAPFITLNSPITTTLSRFSEITTTITRRSEIDEDA